MKSLLLPSYTVSLSLSLSLSLLIYLSLPLFYYFSLSLSFILSFFLSFIIFLYLIHSVFLSLFYSIFLFLSLSIYLLCTVPLLLSYKMTKSRRTQNWADDDDDDNRSIDGSRASAQEHFNETNLTRVKYFIQIINSSVFRRLHSDLKSGSWQVEIVSDVASSRATATAASVNQLLCPVNVVDVDVVTWPSPVAPKLVFVRACFLNKTISLSLNSSLFSFSTSLLLGHPHTHAFLLVPLTFVWNRPRPVSNFVVWLLRKFDKQQVNFKFSLWTFPSRSSWFIGSDLNFLSKKRSSRLMDFKRLVVCSDPDPALAEH